MDMPCLGSSWSFLQELVEGHYYVTGNIVQFYNSVFLTTSKKELESLAGKRNWQNKAGAGCDRESITLLTSFFFLP
jgi:hypothetical protein